MVLSRLTVARMVLSRLTVARMVLFWLPVRAYSCQSVFKAWWPGWPALGDRVQSLLLVFRRWLGWCWVRACTLSSPCM